ncbi:hypothetical protein ALC53_01564, partial [Atta colombica]
IWPCYENENMGRAMSKDWSGSQGCTSESEVACLSSPFRMKKKKEKKGLRRHVKYV